MMKFVYKTSTVLVVFALVVGMLPGAAAESRAQTQVPGWEGWAAELYQFLPADTQSLFFTCPKANATDEEIYYYVGKLISENLDVEAALWLFFPQPDWTQAEGDAWALANGGLLRRKRQYGDSYLDIGMNFQNGNIQICVQSAEPDRELAAKVAEVGEAARAASDTVRWQLDYINRYLCDMVTYGAVGEKWQYDSAHGALINGYAMCAGYTDAMALLCDYLQIPNVEISNLALTHAWNSVYVDGAWRFIDVTWNDPGVIAAPTAEDVAALYERWVNLHFLTDGFTEGDYNISEHEHDAAMLAAQQAAILKGWGNMMVPHKILAATNYLTAREVLRGDENGNLNLNAGLTRAELATILTRISGAEDEVLTEKARYAALCTFADVPDWAAPYVGYCVEQGLVTGYNTTTYGAADPVTPAALCTVILRHMGYPETDWNYNTAIIKAASVGLVSPYWPTGSVALRADIALLAYAAMD